HRNHRRDACPAPHAWRCGGGLMAPFVPALSSALLEKLGIANSNRWSFFISIGRRIAWAPHGLGPLEPPPRNVCSLLRRVAESALKHEAALREVAENSHADGWAAHAWLDDELRKRDKFPTNVDYVEQHRELMAALGRAVDAATGNAERGMKT